MRSSVWSPVALVLLSACSMAGTTRDAHYPASQSPSASTDSATRAAPPAEPSAADGERAANFAAYRFVYLPAAERLAARQPGGWIAIAGGRVLPAVGEQPVPAATMDLAAAAADAVAPRAQHRFVFQVGEDGNQTWPMGGCEVPHVLGTKFLALLERPDISVSHSPTHPSVTWREGDRIAELTVKSADDRMYLQPLAGAPGADGTAGAAYCVSTGFGGMATMTPASAAGLERWEIPGIVRITEGVYQSGDCRRARARLRWANTPLDFTVPVAIWPK